jgi:hypothetical protein
MHEINVKKDECATPEISFLSRTKSLKGIIGITKKRKNGRRKERRN